MGYRSEGKVYLTEKARKLLPENLAKDLAENWDKDEEYEDVWSFDGWKWYSSYGDVHDWEIFFFNLYELSNSEDSDITETDWDITIVGEDGAIYEDISNTYSKFSTYTVIGIN